MAATEQARATERDARKARGVPYAEFVENWVTDEPPAHLPYYGSWGPDNTIVHATAWTTHGPAKVAGPATELPQIFLPDPNLADHPRPAAHIAELGAAGDATCSPA